MRAALLLALLLLVPGMAAAQPTRIELRNERIFVPVEISGHAAAALLDSGAEMTLVDSGYAREIGLKGQGGETLQGSGGDAKVTFAEGVTLKIAGKTFPGLTVAILDLTDISQRLNRGVPIRLIVGREFFDSGRWTIDLAAGTLAEADRAAAPAGVRLQLTTVHGIEALPVSVEGLPPVLAVFDLGNGSGVMVGKAYAERVGFTRDGRPQRRAAGGGIGGSVDRTMVTLARLDVAGRAFRDIPAAIDEQKSAEDLNIGTSILRHFRITVDYAEHALWLEPLD
jgi:predicted aspartyl protease